MSPFGVTGVASAATTEAREPGIVVGTAGGTEVNAVLDAQMRRELVVWGENRIGLLAEMARVLSEMGMNLLAVAVEVDGDRAALHLLTDAQLYARDALEDAGYVVEEREVVVLELPNRPGFLCRVTEALARKEIDIHELYATAAEGAAKALVVFTCSNNGKAVQMLRER